MAPKGTSIVGQSCTITEGTHKGKSGVYTRDGDGRIWCEGDFGGTECTTGSCSNAKAQTSIFEYPDADGSLVHEVDGLVDVEGLGIFQVNMIFAAATGESRNVTAVPIAATPLSSLRESQSKVERHAADLLESHLKRQGRTYTRIA